MLDPTKPSLLLVTALLSMAAAIHAQEAQRAPDTFVVLFRVGPAWDPAKPPSEQRHFAAHSANIAALKKEDRLVLGGRFSDVGLVLIRAADEEEARALIQRDPSVAEGTFKFEIHPWSTFSAGCLEAPRRAASPRPPQ